MEDGAGHDREDSFSFAPQQAYAVQIRLTPELKAELQAAQQAGRAVSLRIRHDGHGGQQAILTIGGQEFFLHGTGTADNTASNPNNHPHDVIQLPDSQQPGSECTVIGSIKQKLSLQRTLDEGFKNRIKARAEAEEMKHKQRKAVLLDKQVVAGGSKAVTKTVTRQVAPQPPKPPPASASRQSALPRSAGNAPPGGAQLVKRSLEPPKPNSKKPAGAGRPAGVNPHTGHTPPPPAVSRPVGLTPPCSQDSTPVCTPPREPTPALVASGPGLAAGGAAGAGPGAGAGAGVAPQPMVQMPAQPQQPPEPPPKAAVQAASLGEAQLCVVAIMLAFQPMHHSRLTNLFNMAYKMARRKPEAKEYVERLIKGCCDRVPPNKMRLRQDVQLRDAPRVEALCRDSTAAPASGTASAPASAATPPSAASTAGAAGPGTSYGSGAGTGVASAGTEAGPGPGSAAAAAAAAGQGSAGLPGRAINKRVSAGGRTIMGGGGDAPKGGSKKRGREASVGTGAGTGTGAAQGPGSAPPPPPPLLQQQQQQHKASTGSLPPSRPPAPAAPARHRSPVDSNTFDDLGSDDDEGPMVITRGKQGRPGASTGASKKRRLASAGSVGSGAAALAAAATTQTAAASSLVEDEEDVAAAGPGSAAAGTASAAAGRGFAYMMERLRELERLGEGAQEGLELLSGGAGAGPGQPFGGAEEAAQARGGPPAALPPAPPPLRSASSGGAGATAPPPARRVVLMDEDDDEEQGVVAAVAAAQVLPAPSQLQQRRQRSRSVSQPMAHGRSSGDITAMPWSPPPPLSTVGLPATLPTAITAGALATSVGSEQGSPTDIDGDADGSGALQLGPPPVVSQGPSPQSGVEVAPIAGPPSPLLRAHLEEALYYENLELDPGPSEEEEQYKRLCQVWGDGSAPRTIASVEQYEERGREYRDKHELYFRVHQCCNGILMEAEVYRREMEVATIREERDRWHRDLWRLGAKNKLRLQRWQAIKAALSRDLAGIRAEVEAFTARLRQQQELDATDEEDA